MITGFNTDIPYKGTTYHVQTEDKGLDTPLILSLVYVGGAIIASKRTPYGDLIESGFDEKALAERLQRQHKLICAAIRAGRIDDLKKMGGEKEAGARPAQEPAADTPPPVTPPPAQAAEPASPAAPPPEPATPAAPEPKAPEPARTPEPEFEFIYTGPFDIIRPDPSIIKEAPPPEPGEPARAEAATEPVHAPTAPAAAEEPGGEEEGELYLNLVDDEGDFRAGQLATIKIHVGRGKYGQQSVADAAVSVRVLGTSFRPLILTTQTDLEGFAVVRALLPRFTSGRAAIIIRAVSDGDVAELRRIIHQA